MRFFKKIITNFFNELIKENWITVMCWDTESDGDINFCIHLNAYPPIGSFINLNGTPGLFKIESLQIQSTRGNLCIAFGIFTE